MNHFTVTLLTRIAKTICRIFPTPINTALYRTVFFVSLNRSALTRNSKFLSPVKGLAQRPSLKLKDVKAKYTPNIGR